MNKLLRILSLVAVVCAAGLVLSGCGGTQKPKVDVNAAIEDLKGTDPTKKQDALVTLSEVGPVAAPAVPLLIQALKDPDPLNRRLSALALEHIGKPAAAALPELKILMTDSDQTVMISAINAIRSIDPTSVPATNPPAVMTP